MRFHVFEKEFLTRRAFAFLTFVAIVIFIAPLLRIAPYNHMAADDYWFGYLPHLAWKETHSLFAVFTSSLSVVKNIYNTWQGTFTSIFFFAITPGVFGEQYYFIVPYMNIGITFLSTYMLFHAVLRKCLKFDGYTCFSVSGIVSLMQIEFIDAGTSGLYWYNGSVHYMFMQGFTILALAFTILYLQGMEESGKFRQVLRIVLACVCSFMASGANFSTALLNAELQILLLILAIVLFIKTKRKALLFSLCPAGISIIGLIFNMAAPGNSVRQAMFTKTNAPVSILMSFVNSVQKAAKWTDIYVLLILLILLPLLLKAVSRCNYRFNRPELFIALLFCLYTSMFTPAQYSMSSLPIDRNLNICQTFYYSTLILSETYLLGFIEKRVHLVGKIVPTRNKNLQFWVIIPVAGLLAMLLIFETSNQGTKRSVSTSYIALNNIEDGSGRQLHNEYLERLQQYHESPDSILYVNPYTVRPALLFVNSATEVGTGENGEIDYSVAYWYGKEAIYLTELE